MKAQKNDDPELALIFQRQSLVQAEGLENRMKKRGEHVPLACTQLQPHNIPIDYTQVRRDQTYYSVKCIKRSPLLNQQRAGFFGHRLCVNVHCVFVGLRVDERPLGWKQRACILYLCIPAAFLPLGLCCLSGDGISIAPFVQHASPGWHQGEVYFLACHWFCARDTCFYFVQHEIRLFI